MTKSIKYFSSACRGFDISPCGKNNILKFIIFSSWIVNVLFLSSYDFIPFEKFVAHQTENYTQQQIEQLHPVALPPVNNIEFYRSEIGTLSSLDVIIIPHEFKLFERDRGPPFHIS